MWIHFELCDFRKFGYASGLRFVAAERVLVFHPYFDGERSQTLSNSLQSFLSSLIWIHTYSLWLHFTNARNCSFAHLVHCAGSTSHCWLTCPKEDVAGGYRLRGGNIRHDRSDVGLFHLTRFEPLIIWCMGFWYIRITY